MPGNTLARAQTGCVVYKMNFYTRETPPGVKLLGENRLMCSGSRDLDIDVYYSYVSRLMTAARLKWNPTMLIHGGAVGVDSMCDSWARSNDLDTWLFKPEYDKFPKWEAPKVRNYEMVVSSTCAVVLWSGFSGGTSHALDALLHEKKPFLLWDLSRKQDYFIPVNC